MKNQSEKNLFSFLAGVSSGCFAQIALQPIEFVRVRQSAYGRGISADGDIGVLSTCQFSKKILQEEGFFGFYRGLAPALVSSGLTWGVYIGSYNLAKRFFEVQNRKRNENALLSNRQLFISGLFSGLLSSFASHPVLLLKTRMQLNPMVEKTCNCEEHIHYNQTSTGAKRLIGKGVKEMYIGISLSLFSSVTHSLLHFVMYDKLKQKFLEKRGGEENLKFYESFLFSGLTKSFACFVTHPIGVVQTRVQDLNNQFGEVRYTRIRDAVKYMKRTEGLRGFYRGVIPHLLKSFPTGGLVLMTYEMIFKLFNRDHKHDGGCC